MMLGAKRAVLVSLRQCYPFTNAAVGAEPQPYGGIMLLRAKRPVFTSLRQSLSPGEPPLPTVFDGLR